MVGVDVHRIWQTASVLIAELALKSETWVSAKENHSALWRCLPRRWRQQRERQEFNRTQRQQAWTTQGSHQFPATQVRALKLEKAPFQLIRWQKTSTTANGLSMCSLQWPRGKFIQNWLTSKRVRDSAESMVHLNLSNSKHGTFYCNCIAIDFQAQFYCAM